jgi:hypothetical protein
MPNSDNNILKYHKDEIENIFGNKEQFHSKPSRLTIAEKIIILVELQKIALPIIKQRNPDDPRRVREIQLKTNRGIV